LTENSSWDDRLLGEQLKVLSELELDFDLEVTGFQTAEIDVLIDKLETVIERDPDDLLPAIETSAVSVEGDLWQLGKHRVTALAIDGAMIVSCEFVPGTTVGGVNVQVAPAGQPALLNVTD
jgi:hypothetical protein